MSSPDLLAKALANDTPSLVTYIKQSLQMEQRLRQASIDSIKAKNEIQALNDRLDHADKAVGLLVEARTMIKELLDNKEELETQLDKAIAYNDSKDWYRMEADLKTAKAQLKDRNTRIDKLVKSNADLFEAVEDMDYVKNLKSALDTPQEKDDD